MPRPIEISALETRMLLSGVTPAPLPTAPAREFLIDNWDYDVTASQFELNETGGNSGPLLSTALTLSNESSAASGHSLRLTKGPGSFGGYFTFLFGRSGAPGQFLDTQDLYRGFGGLENRSVEQLRFDVRHALASPLVLKVELKDEAGRIVSVTRSIPATGAGWSTVSLEMPGGFSGAANFDWRQVDHIVFVVEDVANAPNWTFLLDHLRLVDVDGAYPDFVAMTDPNTGGLLPQYEQGFLDYVRRLSALYFVDRATAHPAAGGLIQDTADSSNLMTIGGVGFQLTSYVINAQRGYETRAASADRVVRILRHLNDAPQGTGSSGILGYQGFFYHFAGANGLRDLPSELSPIDTALAISGVVTAGQYFDGTGAVEAEIRVLSDAIYRRVNWPFMLNAAAGAAQNQFFLAWRPETNDPGYQHVVAGRPGRFTGTPGAPLTIDYYTDEGLLIALLAMGSPNPAHRLGREVWDAIFRVLEPGANFVKTYPGALFTYQFASTWMDTNRLGADNHPTRPIDFYENTRRAISATRNYAIANTTNRGTWQGGGGATRWGLSAAAGPVVYTNGPSYFAEAARPAALLINQENPLEVGTVTPYAVASSIVHRPEFAIDSLWRMARHDDLNGDGNPDLLHPRFGFVDAFNLDIADASARGTFNIAQFVRSPAAGPWANQTGYAIDQGPMLVMIDNYLSQQTDGRQFIPSLFMTHPGIRVALNALFPDLGPAVVAAAFPVDALPNRVSITFSEDVGGSLSPSDLVLTNLTTGVIVDPAQMSVAYFGHNRTAEFRASGVNGGRLPDGNYRAVLAAAGVTDPSGNPLEGDFVVDFFVFAGDANRDRVIDIADFSILATHFNQPGTFSHGDFDYSGTVGIGDFAILAGKFNTALPPTGARAGLGRPVAPDSPAGGMVERGRVLAPDMRGGASFSQTSIDAARRWLIDAADLG